MNMYRKHWQDIGGVLAMVITGSLALFGKRFPARINGERTLSCLTLAVMQRSQRITTIEELAEGKALHHGKCPHQPV